MFSVFRSAQQAFRRHWRSAIGPLVTLAVLVSLDLLSHIPLRFHNPGVILILAVVFAAFTGGLASGLISAAMAVVYELIIQSEPGAFLRYSDDIQQRLAVLVLAIVAAALMVGILRRHLESRTRATLAIETLEQAHEMVQNIDAIVWEVDARTGRFSFISRPAEAILGHPVESWLSDPEFWRVLLHPDDRDRVVSDIKESLTRGREIDIEHRVRALDGRTVWLRNVVRVIRDQDGRPSRLRGVALDITPRKQADETARRTESELRAVFDSALDTILIFDDRRVLLDANPAACVLLNLPRDRIVGRPLDDFVAPRYDIDGLWSHFVRRGETIGELTLELEDGTKRHVEYTARANFAPGCHVAILRDLTERRKLEERLLHSQKMEAIGRIAGHVAHDFKNLLTVIKGHLELLQDHLGPDHAACAEVHQVLRAADRASEMTHRLLAFGRKQALDPKPLDLNAEIASMEGVLRQMLGEKIRLALATAPRLRPAHADPEGLRQLIMNLATNARDAMPEGGTLTIETADIEDPGAEARAWVSLVVRDTGHGIDRETRARIFEPFFTTKAASGGTGLGLPSAYGFVTQSGGRILVESEPNMGATFKVYLCPAVEPVRANDGSTAEASTRAGHGTILVVDDQQAVLDFICRRLELFGYSVLRAADPQEALDLATQHAGPIHLLMADVVMPRMSGPDLAMALARQRAEMKIMFMSGFDKESVFHPESPDRTAPFLAKPFTAADLEQKVHEILGGSKGGRPIAPHSA